MKDYNELINKIIEQGLVPKDEAWYFCNQLFWALRNESIDNYIQRLKSANTLRPTTMTVGENRSLSATKGNKKKGIRYLTLIKVTNNDSPTKQKYVY